MIFSRNSTIRIGPSQPVACRTAAIASPSPPTKFTATTPNKNARIVPQQAPSQVQIKGLNTPILAGR